MSYKYIVYAFILYISMQLYFIQIYNMYYIFSRTKIKAKELSSHPLLCSNRKMAFIGHFSGLCLTVSEIKRGCLTHCTITTHKLLNGCSSQRKLLIKQGSTIWPRRLGVVGRIQLSFGSTSTEDVAQTDTAPRGCKRPSE